jgi:hypothetical protein
MASHTNSAGYSNEGEHEVATPYNRPRPQWEVKSSPVVQNDPTSGLLAEGGFLTLNDRDRAGLNVWFHNSFKNIFAPLRDRINLNFDKAFDAIHKHQDEVIKLRAENATLRSENATLKKEVHDWLNKKDVEFSREVLKLRNENIALRNDVQKDCALATEIVVDTMIDRVRREFTAEIIKMQNELTETRRGFEVTKIVNEATRATEEGFAGLRASFPIAGLAQVFRGLPSFHLSSN